MDQNETTTPLPDNPCDHWDHRECDKCIADYDGLLDDLEDIIDGSEEPDAG